MISHTPGPWKLHEGGTAVVSESDGGLVASCGFLPRRSLFDEKSNAHLIAAAPEMLEALEAVEIAVMLGNAADDDPGAAREWLQAQTRAVKLVEEVLKKVRGAE
ncbi:MAG: hypothetical protein EOM03_16170 [Clostridia bacterium]|nr:hypothetical protein [Clostridia bacterium]